jgi:hypothetical protein
MPAFANSLGFRFDQLRLIGFGSRNRRVEAFHRLVPGTKRLKMKTFLDQFEDRRRVVIRMIHGGMAKFSRDQQGRDAGAGTPDIMRERTAPLALVWRGRHMVP